MTPVAAPQPPRLARWFLRLRPLGSRRCEVEADLYEAFLERVARDGRSRAARRYFVDVMSVWRWNPSGARVARDAWQDLRHGLRVFRRSPGPVATTIVGLALAIGASTALITLLTATAFARAGVAEPTTAVRVERVWKSGISQGWPYAEFVALREMSRNTSLEATSAISDVVLFSATPPTVVHDDSRRVPAGVISGGYMSTFGARPALGRILSTGDDAPGAAPVAVLGYAFWTQRLNADPSIVGRVVWLNSAPVTVVGVVERRFTGITDVPPAVWMSFTGERALNGDQPLSRTSPAWIAVVARTPRGVTIAQAEAQLGAFAAALDAASGDPYRSIGVRFVPASHRSEHQGTALIVGVLLTAVGLVVLLACVNVANLQLASAFARQREIGVRLALGASKTRIVRQLVTESIVLGWAAGAIGLAFSIWLVPVVSRAIDLSETFDLAPDARVLAFLVLVSSVAGVGAGLAPARYGAHGDVLTPLKGDGPRVGQSGRPSRVRTALISVQAAASLVLLVIATLAVRAALRATQVDLGFDPSHLVTLSATFGRDDETKAYLAVALDRLRALPGVRAVSLADTPPFSGSIIPMTFSRAGATERALLTHSDASYFATLGVRTLRGRTSPRQRSPRSHR